MTTKEKPEQVHSCSMSVAGLDVCMSGRTTDTYFMNIANQVRENHFFALAAKHMKAGPGDAVDIGANIGLTAALFCRARPADALYAIEPSPTAFADLERNVDLNALSNVQCFQMGLGLSPGRLLLSEDPTNSSAAHLSQPAFASDDVAHMVRIETLDTFRHAHDLQPRFLKLDVEGHELNVLRGGLITLAVDRPIIFIEMNSFTTLAYGRESPLDVIGFLQRHSHQVLWLNRDKLQDLSTEADLTAFLHNHYVRNAGVDDLLCLPDASAANLPAMQAELALIRPSS